MVDNKEKDKFDQGVKGLRRGVRENRDYSD